MLNLLLSLLVYGLLATYVSGEAIMSTVPRQVLAGSPDGRQLRECPFICGIHEKKCHENDAGSNLLLVDCLADYEKEMMVYPEGVKTRLACYLHNDVAIINYENELESKRNWFSSRYSPVADALHPTLLDRLSNEFDVSHVNILVHLADVAVLRGEPNDNDWNTMLGSSYRQKERARPTFNVFRTHQVRSTGRFDQWPVSRILGGFTSYSHPARMTLKEMDVSLRTPLPTVSICRHIGPVCKPDDKTCEHKGCRCKTSFVGVHQSDGKRRGWTFYHENSKPEVCNENTHTTCMLSYATILLNATLEDENDGIKRLPDSLTIELDDELDNDDTDDVSLCQMTEKEFRGQFRPTKTLLTSLVTPTQKEFIDVQMDEKRRDFYFNLDNNEMHHMPPMVAHRMCRASTDVLVMTDAGVLSRAPSALLVSVLSALLVSVAPILLSH